MKPSEEAKCIGCEPKSIYADCPVHGSKKAQCKHFKYINSDGSKYFADGSSRASAKDCPFCKPASSSPPKLTPLERDEAIREILFQHGKWAIEEVGNKINNESVCDRITKDTAKIQELFL